MIKQRGALSVPVAIIVAGVIIAGAIVFALGDGVPREDSLASVNGNMEEEIEGFEVPLNDITEDDHIRGDINAPIKIVEFSDTECPFCQVFHETLQQVVEDYDGQVAWVYRHFPLESIHPKAPIEAQATECAADLGGNDAFWAYLDRIFEITPANNGLDLNKLPEIAEFIGLDRKAFNECLASEKYASEVEKDLNDAVASGGEGTPHSIIIAPNGDKFPVGGAQPYEVMKQIIDTLLEV